MFLSVLACLAMVGLRSLKLAVPTLREPGARNDPDAECAPQSSSYRDAQILPDQLLATPNLQERTPTTDCTEITDLRESLGHQSEDLGMVEEPSPDNGDSDLPEWEVATKPSPAAPPEPFQFSMTTLLAVITAYSLLFGLLSWAEVRSVGGFVASVTFVTAIALAQWSPLGGRSPYWTSFRVGGLLGAAAVCMSALSPRVSRGILDWVMITAVDSLGAFLIVGLLSFGLGGLLDILALWVELLCGVRRTKGVAKTGAWPWRTRDQLVQTQVWSRKLRLLVVAILLLAFVLAVGMIQIEERMRSR
jgi:hypothetical protein